jgi:hypothetical protein
MKLSTLPLKITFITAIIIFIVLAIAYHKCNNLPHYGASLILMMMASVVLALVSGLQIWLTNEVMKD